MRFGRVLIIACCVVLAIATAWVVPSHSQTWNGKVVGISDGDTITVMRGEKGEKIRLYGIDTPETHQPYGSRAKHFTSDMVYGKEVQVDIMAYDRYGRIVGIVAYKGQVLNHELIKSGMAWVYDQYCTKQICTEWRATQSRAQTQRTGLWSDLSSMPPWEYRRNPSPEVKRWSQSQSGPAADTPDMAVPATTYSGNSTTKVFHDPGCQHYACKSCTMTFSSRAAALSAGYRACGICRP